MKRARITLETKGEKIRIEDSCTRCFQDLQGNIRIRNQRLCVPWKLQSPTKHRLDHTQDDIEVLNRLSEKGAIFRSSLTHAYEI